MIAQQILLDEFLPYLLKHGKRYKKTARVKARLATAGEAISTYTADGYESINNAVTGDYIVENTTGAKEQYIVKQDSFKEKYQKEKPADGNWNWYQAKGEIMAIEVTDAVLEHFGWESQSQVEAPWKEAMTLKKHDFLVTPLPGKNEIYRIARSEFFETYSPAEE